MGVIAVPLCGVLRVHEATGAGDEELDVDLGMRSAEPEVTNQ